MPLYEVNPQPWSMQQIYSESYVARLESRIAELEQDKGQLAVRIAELEAKFDLEHEAYMDLFHQLSEYERKELERNAPVCGK